MNVLKDTLTVNQVEKINKYFTDKIAEIYGSTGTAIQQNIKGKMNAVTPQMNNKKTGRKRSTIRYRQFIRQIWTFQ